ncbi:adenylate cyclase type 10-like [Suricata suricatta]|uniref:adenylate cyclase type 10-like n=1 Tax=Suricata suricatta TaxID=37032 RepID=UPI0011559693|nr:adenylate cyclase type 10-like [Suricata suricatta]
MSTQREDSQDQAIVRLAAHLPDLIVYGDFSPDRPSVDYFDGVLMFVDISGFTAMTEKFSTAMYMDRGAEQLVEILNHYISAIVEKVLIFGGDILKFAEPVLLGNNPELLARAFLPGLAAGHITMVVFGDETRNYFLVMDLLRLTYIMDSNPELELSLQKYVMESILKQIDDKQFQGYLSELRPVTIMFVNLVFNKGEKVEVIASAIQDVCVHTSSVLKVFRGQINKIFMFDKCGIVGHSVRHEYTVIGQKVNMAARMMMYYPGIVTCDSVTYNSRNLPTYFFKELPKRVMKGVVDPEPIYQCLGLNEKMMFGMAYLKCNREEGYPLLGRDKEIKYFTGRMKEFLVSNRSQVLMYEGLPGHGKSQLLMEIDYLAQGENHRTIAIALTKISFGQNFYTIQMFMANVLGLETCKHYKERETNLQNKIKTLLDEKFQCLLNDIFYVQFPVSQEVSEMTMSRKQKLLETLFMKILEQTVKKERIIFIIDEAQFIDSASWSFMERLIRTVPIFIIMSLSPFMDIPCPAASTIMKNRNTTYIILGALQPKDILNKVCRDLNVKGIPKELDTYLVEGSCGIPLYCEELLKSLEHHRALVLQPMEVVKKTNTTWNNVNMNFSRPKEELDTFTLSSAEENEEVCNLARGVILKNLSPPASLKESNDVALNHVFCQLTELFLLAESWEEQKGGMDRPSLCPPQPPAATSALRSGVPSTKRRWGAIRSSMPFRKQRKMLDFTRVARAMIIICMSQPGRRSNSSSMVKFRPIMAAHLTNTWLAQLYRQTACFSLLWKIYSLNYFFHYKYYSRLAAMTQVNIALETQDDFQIIKAYLDYSLHHQLAGYEGMWFKYEIMAMEQIFNLPLKGEGIEIMSYVAHKLGYTKLLMGHLDLAIDLGSRAHKMWALLRSPNRQCIVLCWLSKALFLKDRHERLIHVLGRLWDLSESEEQIFSKAFFYFVCLDIMLYSGFVYKTFEECLEFIYQNEDNSTVKFQSGILLGLYSSVAIWYARLQEWDNFHLFSSRAENLVSRRAPTALYHEGVSRYMEGQVLYLQKQIEGRAENAEDRGVQLLKDLESLVAQNTTGPVFYPRLYHLMAYVCILMGEGQNCDLFLNTALQLSETQGNVLEKCWLNMNKETRYSNSEVTEDQWLQTVLNLPSWEEIVSRKVNIQDINKNKFLMRVSMPENWDYP